MCSARQVTYLSRPAAFNYDKQRCEFSRRPQRTMDASSKMMQYAAWNASTQTLPALNLVPSDKLPPSSDDFEDEDKALYRNHDVSASFALPHHSESVWKHENLCDFFLEEQLHRRVVRIMFAVAENMADIWEQFDFNYLFHFIPQSMIQEVLQPYVVERPSIAVFGPTNSGKTTLLNVLLGKWWLPEQETPNTEVVWRIANGSAPKRHRRAVESEVELDGSGVWNIEEWLGNGIAKEQALRQREAGKEVFYDLRLPNDLLSCGVELWDTPSLCFDRWSVFERLIFRRKSVIPIFLVDAQECLAEDRDVRFIKTIRSKHPDLQFLLVLGCIDVSLMQLRMDHSFELSTLDSDDEETVTKAVSKNERMRIGMQVPTAKYHRLISSSLDICAISADKVWEELSQENPKTLRYTKRFNEFIGLLLEVQGKRIQRPFYRIYARLTQTILCAKSCLKFLRDENFDKARCLKESRERMQLILTLRKKWTDYYSSTRLKYRGILQKYLEEKIDDILPQLKHSNAESRGDERIESYITSVLISQAIDVANEAVAAELYKKCNEYVRECLQAFEGSKAWIDGVVFSTALKLSNDFIWDRSLIHATPLQKYIRQLTSHFRKNPELQKVQRIISSIDYDRILATVFSSYDALDNDVQGLCEISKQVYSNLTLTCNLRSVLILSHGYFPALESQIGFLDLLSATLDKVHRKGFLKIKDDNYEDGFTGPLPIEGSDAEVAFVVSLQRTRIQDIQKSLRFVLGTCSIENQNFLKPVDFRYDFRKHILVLYPNFGSSLYQALKEESLQRWNLQQAVSMTLELHKASEFFFKMAKKHLQEPPDLGPQFIMIQYDAHGNWTLRIVLMAEIGAIAHYSNNEPTLHLPRDYQKWKCDDVLAYQITVVFWFLIMKNLLAPPSEGAYERKASWKYYMTEMARDKSLVNETICSFFCSAFNSKSMKRDLNKSLKVISEKFSVSNDLQCDSSIDGDNTKPLQQNTGDFLPGRNDKLSNFLEITHL